MVIGEVEINTGASAIFETCMYTWGSVEDEDGDEDEDKTLSPLKTK